jgi:hypothetical protein
MPTTSVTTTVDTRRQPPARRSHRLGRLVVTLMTLAATATSTLRNRLTEARDDEAGNVITDNLAWIVFGVLAIVAIGAMIKTLGSTVVNWVNTQLGV